jgi:hypothetical protein
MKMYCDYEGWGFETVDNMISLAEQKGMKFHGDLDNELPHNELDSFFLEDGQDPIELLLPSCC